MKARATSIGFLAVLMWSLLALFTAASGNVPPFQLAAMCFAIGAMLGLVFLALNPSRIASFKQSLKVWIVGIGGLFGYHFLYFTALRNAPAAEAGLIAYLWPLFIVVGSALLPGERLRWFHVAGAVIAFIGCAILLGQGGLTANSAYTFGYSVAFLCAFFWSGYSLLSRTFGDVPTDIITGFCAASAGLALACHMMLETTVWPVGASQWLAVVGLGLLPLGLAFYAWDYGVKRGNIQLLGVASYAAPILSTLLLVAFGFASATWSLGIACLLVAGGAAIASKDMIFRKSET